MSCAILPVYDWSGSPSYQSGFPMRPVTAMRMARALLCLPTAPTYYAYLLCLPTMPTYRAYSTYSTLLLTHSTHSTYCTYSTHSTLLLHCSTHCTHSTHSTHSVHQAHAAMERVRSTLPYWNASKGLPGSDHIFLFSHDEGGCFAPQPVADAAIILSHWGRLDPEPHASSRYQACLRASRVCAHAHMDVLIFVCTRCTCTHTHATYTCARALRQADNWESDWRSDVRAPNGERWRFPGGSRAMIGKHACHDPRKARK